MQDVRVFSGVGEICTNSCCHTCHSDNMNINMLTGMCSVPEGCVI